jgi:hypothetical protein
MKELSIKVLQLIIQLILIEKETLNDEIITSPLSFINDENGYIRALAASYVDLGTLNTMVNDENNCVRFMVALRTEDSNIKQILLNDEFFLIRELAVKHLSKKDALLISGIDKSESVRNVAFEHVMNENKFTISSIIEFAHWMVNDTGCDPQIMINVFEKFMKKHNI